MKRHAFGTIAIAQMCQVTPPTIIRWLEEGHLPFFTTVGGHRKVWDDDLAAFLKKRNISIPAELKYLESKKVLIVDDEDQVRKVVKRAIQKSFPEIEIYEASDGYEAGHQMALLNPTLVILDIKLPGIDGYKVCKMIRSDPRLGNTKILTISGHNVEESQKRSLKSGADDFLGKPFDMNQLKEKLERLMQL